MDLCIQTEAWPLEVVVPVFQTQQNTRHSKEQTCSHALLRARFMQLGAVHGTQLWEGR